MVVHEGLMLTATWCTIEDDLADMEALSDLRAGLQVAAPVQQVNWKDILCGEPTDVFTNECLMVQPELLILRKDKRSNWVISLI
jgi:hypothetical protein